MPDEFDFVYFDDHDDYDDEYDRYEDYYTETGNDPYGLFTEQTHWQALKARVSRLKSRFLARLHARPDVDDIPF